MNAWIFQGNPTLFDMEKYLAQSDGVIVWGVGRYASEIAPGDAAYIWRSQGKEKDLAGIIAEGTIMDWPAVQPDDAASALLWRGEAEAELAMRVKIRLKRIASRKEILKRDWMKDDSVLRSMLIMRNPNQGTPFPLMPAEEQRLGAMWRKTGSDWGRDEIIAAMHLYEQLQGKPISKIAGSEVEQLAQKIGRAPTGVYNKLMNLRALDPRDGRTGFEGASKLDQVTWDEFYDAERQEIDVRRLSAERGRLWDGISEGAETSYPSLETEERRLSEKSTEWLLAHYSHRPRNLAPQRRSQRAATYERDAIVALLRKRLAGFRCEVDGCTSERFETSAGEYFIEVHHLIPLAAGGPDTLENTAAVCPTHHRLMHHGKEKRKITALLSDKRSKDKWL